MARRITLRENRCVDGIMVHFDAGKRATWEQIYKTVESHEKTASDARVVHEEERDIIASTSPTSHRPNMIDPLVVDASSAAEIEPQCRPALAGKLFSTLISEQVAGPFVGSRAFWHIEPVISLLNATTRTIERFDRLLHADRWIGIFEVWVRDHRKSMNGSTTFRVHAAEEVRGAPPNSSGAVANSLAREFSVGGLRVCCQPSRHPHSSIVSRIAWRRLNQINATDRRSASRPHSRGDGQASQHQATKRGPDSQLAQFPVERVTPLSFSTARRTLLFGAAPKEITPPSSQFSTSVLRRFPQCR